jgi:hypothetical protein
MAVFHTKAQRRKVPGEATGLTRQQKGVLLKSSIYWVRRYFRCLKSMIFTRSREVAKKDDHEKFFF